MQWQASLPSSILITILVKFICCLTPGSAILPSTPTPCGVALEEKILSQIFAGYNKHIRPPSNKATEILVQMRILSIIDVDEKNRLWTVNLFSGRKWYDSRLRFDNLLAGCPDYKYFQFTTLEGVSRIWTPNYSFNDMVSGEIFQLLQPNVVVRLFPNGTVAYNSHESVRLYCKGLGSGRAEFTCPMAMEAYGELDYVLLNWRPNPISQINADIELDDLELGNIDTIVTDNLGLFSTIVANFHFSRKSCLM